MISIFITFFLNTIIRLQYTQRYYIQDKKSRMFKNIINLNRKVDRYTDRYLDRQINRQVNRQIDRVIDKQIHRQTDRQIDI